MATYWLSSIKSDTPEKTVERAKKLFSEHKIFAFTGLIAAVTKGDFVCIYAAKIGMVCGAKVSSTPEFTKNPELFNTQVPLWTFKLEDVRLFIDKPIVPNIEVRKKMDAYRGKSIERNWGWLFQGIRKISEHDFHILTGT